VSKALIITVGGSPEPIVSCIKIYKCEINCIYFICSMGKRESASENMVPAILTQSGYKGEYKKILIDDPDSFEEIYEKTKNTIQEAKEKRAEVFADFTGGTKMMSSVLAMLSALDFQIDPILTIGPRRNIIKISGESRPVKIDVSPARLEKIYQTFDDLVRNYFYSSAYLLLERLLAEGISEKYRKEVMRKLQITRAFSNWDRFDYEKAFEDLKDYSKDYSQQFEYLLKILKKFKNTGYERVFDLITNAKRQAHNQYYDNAVARIYRALELFAQVKLEKEYNINTSHLEKSLDKVKNKEKWERRKDEKREIKIGLKLSYELLCELGDVVGEVFEKNKNEFLNYIKIRNSSNLGHGNKPIGEEEWLKMLKFQEEFLGECMGKMGLKPLSIELPTKI